jgi:surfactin synthase thioesterase subunit
VIKIQTIYLQRLKIFDELRGMRIHSNRMKDAYQVLNTYNANQYNIALPINMLSFYGTDDISIKGDIRDWREYTTQEITFFHFKSGHFYSDSQKENVLQIIEQHIW